MGEALTTLKERLSYASVLAYPDFDRTCIVETVASSEVVAAVLAEKEVDGYSTPVILVVE